MGRGPLNEIKEGLLSRVGIFEEQACGKKMPFVRENQ
jgi:hypothetical protein